MVYNRLSIDNLNVARRMVEDGVSQRRVARFFNVSPSVINRALQRLRISGSVDFRHGGGRQRHTTPAQTQYVRLLARRNPTHNASRINNAFRAATGVVISSRTVVRRLHEYNLRARRRAKCPLLTRTQRAARRAWAQEHMNWTLEEWQNCLFTDESKFNLHHSDGRIFVWRRPGERYHERNMAPQVAYGRAGIIVWGGIILNGRTELICLRRETMNGERYIQRCLLPVVIPFAQDFGDGFIFMDDNARPHRARIVNDLLEAQNIRRMVWPANSPDSNPIEHVWDRMQRQLSERLYYPDTLDELEIALREEWERIPREYINNLIRSMPRRVLAVHRARGGPTRY
jgi:transposase